MNQFLELGGYRRATVIAFVYSVIIGASFYAAYEVRFDFLVPEPYQAQRLHYLWLVIGLKVLALILARQLGSMVSYFGITDLLRMLWAISLSGVALFVVRLFSSPVFVLPRGVLLVDYLLCMAGLCAVRLGTRLFRERISQGEKGSQAVVRVAIVGADDVGASLASEFLNHPRRGLRPVVFFDDDTSKHGKLIHGVAVVGPPDQLARRAKQVGVDKVVIALPSTPVRRIREIVQYANDAGLKVEMLPLFEELASSRMPAGRLRPVEVQDLLGRETVNLDSASIRKLIGDRVVLVTGAGGSIGAELCRQIAALNPKRLLMLDQAEGSLFLIEQEINELGLGATALPLIGDVLDHDRMEYIFSRYRPEVVFHAAAHKHVFLMERQPSEAISNNVLGTRQIARISSAHNVGTFVLISTDKAVNPTGVMGATKRLAEIQIMAIQAMQPAGGTHFIAVRFGNVLGSSGSVIPIFKRQIANGGPVTVTHPDVSRYFMTIPEAVGLVLQSSVLGRGGEIFVLDMGQPVKIVDLARQMIVLSGLKPDEDIEIKFTGLKPGEKLFEEFQHRTEEYQATQHPRIMRFVSQATFSESGILELEQQLYRLETNELKRMLQQLVPEYTAHVE